MVKKCELIYMNCHKCNSLCYDYKVTKNDKTFLYRCLDTGELNINTKDFNCLLDKVYYDV